MYVKDPLELKHQLLINEGGKVGVKRLKNPKAFMDCLKTIDNVYENFQDYNGIQLRSIAIFWVKKSYKKNRQN